MRVGPTLRSRIVTSVALLLFGIDLYPQPFAKFAKAVPHIINPGTAEWTTAARTGRADMLVLGDSVVWSGGQGWDAGLIAGLGRRLGLAGTGLVVDGGRTGEGEQYSHFNSWHSTWNRELNAIPVSRQGYAVRGWALTAGATTPATWVGFGIQDGDLFDTAGAYDFHVWSASPSEGGAMGAFRRLGKSPYTRFATIPPVATSTPVSGLQHTVFRFDAVPGTSGGPHNFFWENITNTSVLYSRLLRPDATGVTVTSWGYGGRSSRDFFTDQYPGKTMSDEGRYAFLSNLVYGGSGKLNVLIAQGFNDRLGIVPWRWSTTCQRLSRSFALTGLPQARPMATFPLQFSGCMKSQQAMNHCVCMPMRFANSRLVIQEYPSSTFTRRRRHTPTP